MQIEKAYAFLCITSSILKIDKIWGNYFWRKQFENEETQKALRSSYLLKSQVELFQKLY